MNFDPNKVLNVFAADKVEKGIKAFMSNDLLKLKNCVEEEKLGHLFKLDGVGYKKRKYDNDGDKNLGDAVFRVASDYSNYYYKFIYPVDEKDLLPVGFEKFEKAYEKIPESSKLHFKNMQEYYKTFFPKKRDEKTVYVFATLCEKKVESFLITATGVSLAIMVFSKISREKANNNTRRVFLGESPLEESKEKILEHFEKEIVEAYKLQEAKEYSLSQYIKGDKYLEFYNYYHLPKPENIDEKVFAEELTCGDGGIYEKTIPNVPHDYSLRVKWEKFLEENNLTPDCKLYDGEIKYILRHPEYEDEVFQTVIYRYQIVEKYKEKWVPKILKNYLNKEGKPDHGRIPNIYRAEVDYKGFKNKMEWTGDCYRWEGSIDLEKPIMVKNLVAYVMNGEQREDKEVYSSIYEGNCTGFVYETPIPLEDALNLHVAHSSMWTCACADLNKKFVYAVNRSCTRAVMDPKYQGLKLFHFVEGFEEKDKDFPFLTLLQTRGLIQFNNDEEQYDNWKVYSDNEIKVNKLEKLTKVPNTLKLKMWVDDILYDTKYSSSGDATNVGRYICRFLKELNLHPIAGTYDEYKKHEEYNTSNMELIIGLNEEGKDYSYNYSKEFWDNECFNDTEVVVIKSNKMNDYV